MRNPLHSLRSGRATRSWRTGALATCALLTVGALTGAPAVAGAPTGTAPSATAQSLTEPRAVVAPTAAAAPAAPANVNILVFHGSQARQDDAVTRASATIARLGRDHDFTVEESEDPAVFSAGNLDRFRGVVFLSAEGAPLDATQEAALQDYIEDGGGFVGVHDAALAQLDSDWFTGLLGTRYETGPQPVREAVVDLLDRQHPATRDLPLTWTRSDRWPTWSEDPSGEVHTVAQVQRAPGTQPPDPYQPISWCRDYEGGRSFYTGMGATAASYTDERFQDHLLGAIQWTSGMARGDCQATITSNYQIERLTAPNQPGKLDQIGEPHGLDIAADGTVFYIGKAACPTGPIADWEDPDVGLGCGTIHQWDPETDEVTLLTTLDVMGNRGSGSELVKNEEGLVGIALDPDFEENHWIYAYWMPHESIDTERRVGLRTISRFTYDPSTPSIDQGTREDLLQWETQIHSCCHAGGGMDFDDAGNLYVGSGDSNSSGGSDGYSGNNWTEEYAGISFQDARRTSGNTNDLNGKILRIHPEDDGTYTIPAGNLFSGQEEGGGKTRPEIYVMGVRNISRLAIDAETDWLTAGWVGPDAGAPSTTWGPAKYDTASVITSAGNQGWPYCMGNRQPYRDRSNTDATQPAGWYDCDDLENTSPRNTGLVDIPDARDNAIWYSPQGGGPVFPDRADGSGVPTYVEDETTYTQPYLKGGGQAIMSGPTYHQSQVDADSDVAWPAYWEDKWFIGDQSNSGNRVAVTLDPDRVAEQGAPAFGEDIRGIVTPGEGDDQLQSWMDAKFGPDGALYLLDYGSGFFSLHERQKLSRVTYHGGAPTPVPTVDAQASAQSTPTAMTFSGSKAGGVSYAWDFGDGATSTQADPTHTYTEGGTYTTTLDVTYADGEQARVERDVEVACAAPDARATVRFLDHDTGVANHDVREGCTVNDVIDDEGSWGNNAQFVTYVEDLAARMEEDGSINATEEWLLGRAARVSGVGTAGSSSYRPLFDGTQESLDGWEQAPGGSFELQDDGTILSSGGLGMLWYAERPYADYSLRLQFQDLSAGDVHANSGVFTRFPDPRIPLEDRPSGSCGTVGAARTSPAWVAIYCGQEIQIYDGESGEPQKTGSVYNFDPVGLDDAAVTEKGTWNDYEVRVVGQRYTIWRNGVRINTFDNTPGKQSSRAGDPPTDLRQFVSGFIGLQNHGNADVIAFRNVRIRPL